MKNKLPYLLLVLVAYSYTFAEEYSFKLGMIFHFEGINTELIDLEYKVNGMAQEITEQHIDSYNSNSIYKNYQYNTGILCSYNINSNFYVDALAGISFLKHETMYSHTEELDHTFTNNTPGYFFGFGFSYSYLIFDKISATINPNIKYVNYSDVGFSDPNGDIENYIDSDIEQSFFHYNIPLIFTYDFEWIKPGLGFCYFNYIQNIKFDGTIIDDFSNKYDINRDILFNQNSVFGGIVHLDITINRSTSIITDFIISDGAAGNIKFQFGL